MSVKQVLFKASSLELVTMLASVLLSLLMTPFILKTVGREMYGLWVLVGDVISFGWLIDVGLRVAVQRYLAQYVSRSDFDSARKVYATGIVIFSGLGLVVILFTLVLLSFAHSLVPDPALVGTWRIALMILGVDIALLFPLSIFSAILSAHLRHELSSFVQFAKVLVRFALMFVAVYLGYSVIGMAAVTLIVDVLACLAILWLSFRVAPWIKFSFSNFSKPIVRQLMDFGGHSLLVNVANRVNASADSVIISRNMGLAGVSLYSVAMQISRYYQDAVSSCMYVFFPFFVQRYETGDKELLRRDFMLLWRIFIAFAFAGGMSVYLVAETFIRVWLGEEFTAASVPLGVLVLAFAVSLPQELGKQLFYAASKHRLYSYLSVVETCLKLVLSIVLVVDYKQVGVALGTLVSVMIFRVLVQGSMTAKLVGVSIVRYYWPMVLVAGVCGGYFYIVKYVIAVNVPSTYIHVGFAAGVFFSTLFALSMSTIVSFAEAKRIVQVVYKRK